MSSEPTQFTKDIQWFIDGTFYTIRNIPHMIRPGETHEEILHIDADLLVSALLDMMVEDKLPTIVDYNDHTYRLEGLD